MLASLSAFHAALAIGLSHSQYVLHVYCIQFYSVFLAIRFVEKCVPKESKFPRFSEENQA